MAADGCVGVQVFQGGPNTAVTMTRTLADGSSAFISTVPASCTETVTAMNREPVSADGGVLHATAAVDTTTTTLPQPSPGFEFGCSTDGNCGPNNSYLPVTNIPLRQPGRHQARQLQPARTVLPLDRPRRPLHHRHLHLRAVVRRPSPPSASPAPRPRSSSSGTNWQSAEKLLTNGAADTSASSSTPTAPPPNSYSTRTSTSTSTTRALAISASYRKRLPTTGELAPEHGSSGFALRVARPTS
jgi:hypothetical protein